MYPRASSHAEKRNCKIPLTPAGRGRVRKLGIRWLFSGMYPRAAPHAEKRNCKIPFTPAGRGRVRKLEIRWLFSGMYPRASPHAEKEELENSTHARGTRAGTKAGDSLVVLWTVPACVPHAEKRNWKIPLTPAGRARVRKRVIRWWFSGLYPRASSHAENEELENSFFRPRDAGGYGRWGVAGVVQGFASSRSEDAPIRETRVCPRCTAPEAACARGGLGRCAARAPNPVALMV